MDGSTRFRALAVAALLVFFTFITAANFVPKEERLASDFWPDDGLRLGLDLRGGIHWVLGVELEEAITRELEFVRKSIEERLSKDQVNLASSSIANGELVLVLAREEDRAKTIGEADDTTVLERVGGSGLELRYRLTEDWKADVRERTMSQVLEVMRRRIDDPQTGVPDSVITRQGKDRVLVQIPGEQIERDRLRSLVGTTGFLAFKIVEDSDNSRGGPARALSRGPSRRPDDRAAGRRGLGDHGGGVPGAPGRRHHGRLSRGRAPSIRSAAAPDRRVPVQPGGRRDLRRADGFEYRQAAGDHPRRAGLQRADRARPDLDPRPDRGQLSRRRRPRTWP